MDIKLLLIDEKRQSIVLNLTEQQFRCLNIDKTQIKKHQKRIDLNQTVTEYLNSFKTK